MAALRDPDSGCPWDIRQSFASIIPYTIEEAHEVADAIARDDMEDLRDELGDLLLQVVYHARMAHEIGEFSFGDVVMAVTEKMIRRHPHVFAKHLVADEAAVTGLWNRIKAGERAEKAKRRAARGENEPPASRLDAVSGALPALIQSLKLQQEAAKVGFDWVEAPPILDKIAEETTELREAMAAGDRANIHEEYGDLLFAMVNLGRHLKVDPEVALRAASAKFRQRFAHIETELKRQDLDIAATPLDDMEALWQQAKTAKAQN